MNENEDPKLRDLLKKSPALTPPESFYRGVLQELERKEAKAEEKAPWYWGYPAKTLATACALVIMVLVTRQAKKNEPGLFQQAENEAPQSESRPAPSSLMMKSSTRNENKPLEGLAGAPEVQNRVNRSITEYVGNPSPFEEIDEKAKDDLRSTRKGASLADHDIRAARPATLKALESIPQSTSSGAKDTESQWKGDTSGIAEFRTVVLRFSGEWQILWQEHMQYKIPRSFAPVIDFDRYMVVGVFSGTKPTAGYSVEITEIQTLADKINVVYRETVPPAGAITAQILTQPYHLRVIPKTTLPVTFQKQPS